MLDWLTLIFAAIAAVGSLVRVAQNESLYNFHRKVHKMRKKK